MKRFFHCLALVVVLAGETPAQPLDKAGEAAAKKLFDGQAIGIEAKNASEYMLITRPRRAGSARSCSSATA